MGDRQFQDPCVRCLKSFPTRLPYRFRDVTNRTNTRTLVASLIPPSVVTVQTAPWVLWLDPEHAIAEEAYLLGLMSSIPMDWWCRSHGRSTDRKNTRQVAVPADSTTLPASVISEKSPTKRAVSG